MLCCGRGWEVCVGLDSLYCTRSVICRASVEVRGFAYGVGVANCSVVPQGRTSVAISVQLVVRGLVLLVLSLVLV